MTTHGTIIATTTPTSIPVRRGAGIVGAVGNGVVGNGVVGNVVAGKGVAGAGARVLSAKTGLGSSSFGSVTTALAACSARFTSIKAAVRSV